LGLEDGGGAMGSEWVCARRKTGRVRERAQRERRERALSPPIRPFFSQVRDSTRAPARPGPPWARHAHSPTRPARRTLSSTLLAGVEAGPGPGPPRNWPPPPNRTPLLPSGFFCAGIGRPRPPRPGAARCPNPHGDRVGRWRGDRTGLRGGTPAGCGPGSGCPPAGRPATAPPPRGGPCPLHVSWRQTPNPPLRSVLTPPIHLLLSSLATHSLPSLPSLLLPTPSSTPNHGRL
jgi:hypothetical protein